MLEAVRDAFGEEGIERLTDERTRKQAESYRARMPGPTAPLEERVAMLARIRSEEGYMAEWRRRDGALQIVENHCAIAQAARLCSKLCGGELALFRTVLGDDVAVERVEHILSGDRCCCFRIAERSNEPAVNGSG
jgi:predicted ArsR family transcriptional regulator